MSQQYTWCGMELEVSHDEDGIIETVKAHDNEDFLDFLSEYYVMKLQNDFDEYMDELGKEYATEQALSHRDDVMAERATFNKHGDFA